MTNQQQPENLDAENHGNLNTLVRAITISQGEFSLILLRCNYDDTKNQISTRLYQLSSPRIQEIYLSPNAKTLYTNISEQLGDEQPPALMVFGLELVQNIDTVLISANQVREEFRNNFRFPMLLWVNDKILKKLVRLATDLNNWATIIEFTPGSHELITFLQKETDEIFASDTSNIIKPQICFELENAQKDLQNQGQVLNPAIKASLEFVFGIRDYFDNKLDLALKNYQQSLSFWQESNNLEKQGRVLVNIGLVYSRKGIINQVEWENAKNCFQQSLDIFEQIQLQDLIAKYISLLGEVYQNLKEWTELEKLANKSLELHRNPNYGSLLQIAQDYGFLAKVALEKSSWNEAKNFAEKAIQTLVNVDDIPESKKGFYQFLLAKSYHGLGDISTTIQNLEIAKNDSNSQYNPQQYISILEKLRLLYFQQHEYSKAFHCKQEQLQIEQQYGFRAFLGASYLNPQKQIIDNTKLSSENTEIISQAITASGREKNIAELRTRISNINDKLIVIHGQSGVGKTSILQAGLIPALKQQPIAARHVLPILMRSYKDWVKTLGEYLDVNAFDSTTAILDKLRNNANGNFLTVLIFDQFEEFFFVYKDSTQRQAFYNFLEYCIEIPFVKIILSLREDYLHYLLELERKFINSEKDSTKIDAFKDILRKDIRYYLGNLSPDDAKNVIQSLTEKTKFSLQFTLIDKLVEDLAGEEGEVRPIELQIVGKQLETEKIRTLEEYLAVGKKEKLVEKFLEEVVQDCGIENEKIAKRVLFLLTDENGIRPLKTHADFVEQLKQLNMESARLDLVLEILVKSGLVLFLPASENYQLVHDYLVSFIRKQNGNEILAELEKEREQRLQAENNLELVEEKAKQILANAKKAKQSANIRLAWTSTLSVIVLIFTGVYVESFDRERKQALQGTNLEREGVNSLRQFEYSQLEGLMVAMQTSKELKNIVKDGRSLENYPAFSPIYALHTILDNIKERNQFSGHKGSVYSVSFSPDGKTIATTSSDNTTRLWNLQGQLIQAFIGHQGSVLSVSFSPDGKTIATASSDNTARLWNLQGQLIQEFIGHEGSVISVSFSPDGKTIATASSDNTARLWNLQGQLIQEFIGHQVPVNSVSFSPDGKTIATASSDNTARLWNLQGQLIREFKGYKGSVISVSFSPDGKTIATASLDNTVRLWNLQGQLIQELKWHQGFVRSVSFSPDGKTIATASSDNTARLWNLQGQLIQEFIGHEGSVISVSFSPDGKTIATASLDNTARLWNLQGQLIQELKWHQGFVRSVSFSPDGKTIATASSDNTARLWNLQGQLIQEFIGHEGSVISVSFSPDGKTIATASLDNTARLWGLTGTTNPGIQRV